MNRRSFLTGALWACASSVRAERTRQPNIIVILADDLGYGDLGCYGSPIRTPHLDRIAAEGMRFEQCYSASSVCTPARASLLTGRYAVRMGLPSVLFPNENRGLPDTETTMAQMLRESGYTTACVGKWHLGDRPQYGPTARGFDEFFGIPYSNDMDPLPLLRNRETVEQSTPNAFLTKRFTLQALDFIARSKDKPFFLYLAHCAPHIPIGVSPEFAGASGFGPYGDAVQEVDWSVGQIMAALKENGLDDNTMVVFTSDNGPWYQGSAGRLRGRKGESYEGGMRVPMLARMPGRIPAGSTAASWASHLDLLPTLAALAGASLPERALDGTNITAILENRQEEPRRDLFLYFDCNDIQSARQGEWKLHLSRSNEPPWIEGVPDGRTNLPLLRPELYNVEKDGAESYECSQEHRDVVAAIQARVQMAVETFPDPVRSAWRETYSRKTRWTPTGAFPVQAKP